MNFIRDLAEIAKSEMDHLKVNHSDIGDERAIIDRWMNVRMKLIYRRPRSVRKSRIISKRILSSDHRRALKLIESKCSLGEDLNPYQGKGLFSPDFTDYLLADWGIHHLHLSTEYNKNCEYYMARSDLLLFALFTEIEMYFIDIRPHGEKYVFAQKELLEILHAEAPDLIDSFSFKGAFDIYHIVDDPEMIENMRKAGINVIQKVGDTVYGPMGGGLTTAATASQLTIEVDYLYRRIKAAENWIQENEEIIKVKMTEAIGSECKILDLHLQQSKKGLFIMDKRSGCEFPLNHIV